MTYLIIKTIEWDNLPNSYRIVDDTTDINKANDMLQGYNLIEKDKNTTYSIVKFEQPLVLKEAYSHNIPILMHKIDSYLDKYDKKATYLSTENNLNFLKIKHLLDMKDGDVNVVVEYDGDMSKQVKININFLLLTLLKKIIQNVF